MRVQQDRNSEVSLEVSVQWGADGDVVFLVGEFDFTAASRVGAVIDALLAGGRREILVDLEGVTFMDGGAIGALISAHERALRVAGSLEVTSNALCLRLLEVTGELDRLSVRESAITGGNDQPVSPIPHANSTTVS